MIGTTMGVLALIMIPLGFVLAWGVVRMLDARAADEQARDGSVPAPRPPHPSTLPAVPLDDAPSHVIAAVAQNMGAPQRRSDGF